MKVHSRTIVMNETQASRIMFMVNCWIFFTSIFLLLSYFVTRQIPDHVMCILFGVLGIIDICSLIIVAIGLFLGCDKGMVKNANKRNEIIGFKVMFIGFAILFFVCVFFSTSPPSDNAVGLSLMSLMGMFGCLFEILYP